MLRIKLAGSAIAALAITFLLVGIVKADSGAVLSTLVTPQSPEDTTTIDQRLSARKVTYKSQLSAGQMASIAAKCTLAQAAMNDVRTKDTKAAAIRLDAYSALAKRLSYLVDNLAGQGVDGEPLLLAQNDFVAALNVYLVDASNYKAAMDDAINVDCKKDPAGFMASLLDARKLRAQLASDSAASKSKLTGLRQAVSTERQILIKNPGKAPTGFVGTKSQ